ncbi:ATP-binding protein [Alkalihalobacterium chitinilyticum]|uniref:histidine kinase n=1 Tax=Alkalihalobacterium chitinilyticum TaxID=2980103 RepID=A0ABT5VJS3_9BACI|nr:ATP-binding protein [Alkalihalobacterium chitinilyticum]MDE5415699.1 ATP-binding protein [Alkalihalobacterium chitinilyticum]
MFSNLHFQYSMMFTFFFDGLLIGSSFVFNVSTISLNSIYFKFIIIQATLLLVVLYVTTKLLKKRIYNTHNQSFFHKINRLHAISNLTAAVAHEIRNPLTSAKGFLQLLIAEKALPLKEQEYVQLILREITTVEEVVEKYIRITHPGQLCLTASSLDILLYEISMDLSGTSKSKNIDIVVSLRNNGTFQTDIEKLKCALSNIIMNGIEAMPNGGKITIDGDVSKQEVTIRICDEGIGMTESELDRIGAPFYSLKEKGTGLGLMLCYQLIHCLSGRIEVYSKKGVGSTFIIYLPIQKKELALNIYPVTLNHRTEGQN